MKIKLTKKQLELILLFAGAILFYEIIIRFFPVPSAPASFSGDIVIFLQAELSNKAMDYFAVTAYIIAYPLLVFGTAVFLVWRRDFSGYAKYFWIFMIAQALAAITWFIYPVSPPRLAIDGVRGIRMAMLGFTQAGNPFAWGAFPSMHAANGLAGIFFVRKHGGKILVSWVVLWILMIYSAIYLGEHYWQDIVAGGFYFLVTYLIVTKASGRLPLLKKYQS